MVERSRLGVRVPGARSKGFCDVRPDEGFDIRRMSYVEPRTAVTPAHARAQDLDHVRSHLAAAVLCALVCFAPLGIAAVVWAGNVRTRLALGDVEGARSASRMVRRLCWASAAVTAGFLLLIVVGAGGYSDVH